MVFILSFYMRHLSPIIGNALGFQLTNLRSPNCLAINSNYSLNLLFSKMLHLRLSDNKHLKMSDVVCICFICQFGTGLYRLMWVNACCHNHIPLLLTPVLGWRSLLICWEQNRDRLDLSFPKHFFLFISVIFLILLFYFLKLTRIT